MRSENAVSPPTVEAGFVRASALGAIVLLACLVVAASSAPLAVAAARVTASSTASGQAFAGLSLAQHQYRINANYYVKCNTTRWSGTTPTLPSGTLSFQLTYGNCALSAAGTFYAAGVTCGTATLSGANATYSFTTFATSGLRLTYNGSCVASVIGTNCVITIPSQTVSSGISAQNRNSTDTANAATGGSRLTALNAGPISGSSSGCATLGVPSTFTSGDHSGTVQITPHSSGGTSYIGLWATT